MYYNGQFLSDSQNRSFIENIKKRSNVFQTLVDGITSKKAIHTREKDV